MTGVEPASTGGPLEPLIGRNCALDLFDRALCTARTGQPSMLEFVGDPGCGKTRLLRELAVRGGRTAVPVLAAAGRDGDRVQRLLTALADPAAPAAHRPDPVTGVMVLLLDDLHLVSPAVAALLARLAQAPPAGLLLVVAYRPRQMPGWATSALGGVVQLNRRTFTLAPLDPAGVAALLGCRTAGPGNACTACPAGCPATCSPTPRGAGRGGGRAAGAARGVAVRGHRRGPTGRGRARPRPAADAGGGLGVREGFEPTLAGALACRDPAATSDLLDGLVAADLLRTDPALAPTLRFRHEVDRAVVYRSLSPGRRRRLHAIAADILRDLGHPVTRYAEHLSAGGQCTDPATADALIEAAESPQTPRLDAIRWLTGVRRLLPDAGPADPRRVRLDFATADALVGAGRLRQARTLLQDLSRRGCRDEDQRVRALVARARVERLLGRPFDAYALVLPCLDAPAGPRARFDLTVEAAVAGALCGVAGAGQHACDLGRPRRAVGRARVPDHGGGGRLLRRGARRLRASRPGRRWAARRPRWTRSPTTNWPGTPTCWRCWPGPSTCSNGTGPRCTTSTGRWRSAAAPAWSR